MHRKDHRYYTEYGNAQDTAKDERCGAAMLEQPLVAAHREQRVCDPAGGSGQKGRSYQGRDERDAESDEKSNTNGPHAQRTLAIVISAQIGL